MKCPRCNSKIKDNSKFCIRCGFIFYDYLKCDDKNLENDLMKVYTKGEIMGNHSFKYLILSFLYSLYKGMYLEGIISFISDIVLFKSIRYCIMASVIYDKLGIAYLFMFTPIILACIVIRIFYFLNFNEKYISKSYQRIIKIINSNKKEEYTYLRILIEKTMRYNFLLSIISLLVFITVFMFL